LTKEEITLFLALVQAENRIQIPIEIRQHFKLQPGSFLKIQLVTDQTILPTVEKFLAKLSKDGRITIPWEARLKLQTKPGQIIRAYLTTKT
jgi:bifunctional DNA-binding transcriptional regulator/antitoxin component of YhaV-PrlF toxin-antitoxin module